MNNITECHEMELHCLQRAKAEPANGWKWLGLTLFDGASVLCKGVSDFCAHQNDLR